MKQQAFNKEISMSELNYYREQGKTNKEIAQLLGTSTATISKYLPSSRGSRARMSTQDDRTIKQLFDDGYSVAEIAARYNCCIATVYRKLKDQGVTFQRGSGTGKASKKETTLPEREPDAADNTQAEIRAIKLRLGKYIVDIEEQKVMIPEIPRWMDKETIGYLIRDLMMVWKEV